MLAAWIIPKRSTRLNDLYVGYAKTFSAIMQNRVPNKVLNLSSCERLIFSSVQRLTPACKNSTSFQLLRVSVVTLVVQVAEYGAMYHTQDQCDVTTATQTKCATNSRISASPNAEQGSFSFSRQWASDLYENAADGRGRGTVSSASDTLGLFVVVCRVLSLSSCCHSGL